MFRTLIATLLATFALAATAAVDANQATQAELETVKGIGPALSGKILDARKAAQFKDWNDFVDRVGGVGAGNAKRFSQAGLTVGGASFDGAAMASPAADKPGKATKASAEGRPGKARAEKSSS